MKLEERKVIVRVINERRVSDELEVRLVRARLEIRREEKGRGVSDLRDEVRRADPFAMGKRCLDCGVDVRHSITSRPGSFISLS